MDELNDVTANPLNAKIFAGCIVLYNPEPVVTHNIASYLGELAALYVIDNTETVDEKIKESILALGPKIHYICNNENAGIAKALNTGCRAAVEHGYQWLLTMDQDSFFADGAFFELVRNYNTSDSIGIFSAAYTKEYDRWVRKHDDNFDEIYFVITSGNIISLQAWQEVKGFEDKLFIDEVDHDYCLKLRTHKYEILVSKNIFMHHQIGEVYQSEGTKTAKKVSLHSPLRYYYIARNGLYISKKFFFSDFRFASARLYYLFKRLAKIILVYPKKRTYLRFYFKGVFDFVFSRYGKYNSR